MCLFFCSGSVVKSTLCGSENMSSNGLKPNENNIREVLEFDVLIVGAGPAGLATACKLKQLNAELSVCVLEKGSEVGAHILSGALIQTTALDELFPDWSALGAPLNVPVTEDEIFYFTSASKAIKFPKFAEPKLMRNEGNYVISLGEFCRWLAQQAEKLGVEVYPGFAASEILYGSENEVQGVLTGDMGVDIAGAAKETYMAGMELRAKYTVFSEGCRGHLGKELMDQFDLREGKDPQHYGLGIKEIWEIDSAKHVPGRVLHSTGWPCSESNTSGGAFLYHLDKNRVALGLISELSYRNTYYDPFEEMQRWKTHPTIKAYLEGGKRISYGARALAKGGIQSLPKMVFPGGLLVGCDAGTMNNGKIKGSHTAMKSGMLAAEVIVEALGNDRWNDELSDYTQRFKDSWIYKELHEQRNWGPAIHRWGNIVGGAIAFLDAHILGGRLPVTLHECVPDHEQMLPSISCKKIAYKKPDGVLTFSKLDSVFLSNTNHTENQPIHLKLTDPGLPLAHNLPLYDEPAQRYCPAGVYEITVNESGKQRFQINAQNCVHCKTCDIKDPEQNIKWVVPEGGGGPNYADM